MLVIEASAAAFAGPDLGSLHCSVALVADQVILSLRAMRRLSQLLYTAHEDCNQKLIDLVLHHC
jgi:hypothetical protein